jgi:hypothetical protein
VLGYYSNKVLVQGNSFTDFTVRDSKAIGPKTNNSFWFIRDNRININSGQGIWVDTYVVTQQIEIAYNLVRTVNDDALWIGQETGGYGAIESYRNTYVGGDVRIGNLNNGPVRFTDDVIVNSSTTSNKITLYSSDPSRLITTGLLTGLPNAGIVDSNGNLSAAYSQYVGSKGYERGTVPSARPLPPDRVIVE